MSVKHQNALASRNRVRDVCWEFFFNRNIMVRIKMGNKIEITHNIMLKRTQGKTLSLYKHPQDIVFVTYV